MFIFAHLAAGYLAGRLWNRLVPHRAMNSFLAMLGGVLPDLVDKPLSLLPGWSSTRTLGHTLVFVAFLFVAGKGYPAARPLALGATTHLLLDAEYPHGYAKTLLWPLLGPDFQPPRGEFTWDLRRLFDTFQAALDTPSLAVPEVAGIVVLSVVALRHLLFATGVLQRPAAPPTREQRFRERISDLRAGHAERAPAQTKRDDGVERPESES